MKNIVIVSIMLLTYYAIVESLWFWVATPMYSGFFASFSKDGVLRVRDIRAAMVSYLILAIGALYFVILPIRQNRPSYARAIMTGLIFGLVIYGVYNATNKATIPGYPWKMVLVDTIWGMIAMASVAAASRFAFTHI